ncbi:MAG: hypothetical protein Q8N39_04670 [Pelolinea sp.]|nr:hypothetical protein [Pelolinea sp.]
MNLTMTQKVTRFSSKLLDNLSKRSNSVYMAIIVAALVAFEVFNFSTTDFALRGMFGSHSAGGMNWSTILALAFCGMDFAGIARLMAPRQEEAKSRDSWFLLGAWVLAAAMNAGLTWWAISIAVYNQPVDSALILDPMTFVTAVPVLVAVMVWVIRILIIGTLVSSLNQVLNGNQPKKEQVKQQPFGFRPGAQPVPAGFRPVPNQARAQQDSYTR